MHSRDRINRLLKTNKHSWVHVGNTYSSSILCDTSRVIKRFLVNVTTRKRYSNDIWKYAFILVGT